MVNDKGYVDEDRGRKVMLGMEKVNYYGNEVAGSVYKREWRVVGVLLRDIRNGFFVEVVGGGEEELEGEGYRVMMGNRDEELEKELE